MSAFEIAVLVFCYRFVGARAMESLRWTWFEWWELELGSWLWPVPLAAEVWLRVRAGEAEGQGQR